MVRTTVNPETQTVQPSFERTAASADYNWRVMLANALVSLLRITLGFVLAAVIAVPLGMRPW